jgi:hypothetical protein
MVLGLRFFGPTAVSARLRRVKTFWFTP